MRKTVAVATLAAIFGTPIMAQVAGSTQVGVSIIETREIATGWSVRKSVLGRDVYNEKNERIGKVEDIIISPDKNASFLIVGAGGFVGIGRHDVAIPVDQIHEENGKIKIPGATKAIVKAMPEFEYAPRQN